ncbi:ribosomal protein S18-alanine N-acetyltransferase [Candidatus Desantisbacteria bacterium]|nr:ribosomal protein S18-alanine N-acetyltransferase [Candidatus Desantisbacteria bacterium]
MQKNSTNDGSYRGKTYLTPTFSTMTMDDVPQVAALEKMCFSIPWSEKLFVNEIENNNSYFLTATIMNKLIGYAGFWLIIDEAHIVNLAVHPEFRRQGIGEMLLKNILDLAKQKGALKATLEVRETNTPANLLYERLGFVCVALRKGYYADTKEHAMVMWVDL